ncbi:MAG: HTTM domain-containing protein [Cyclobacteriaceae bacterium]
MQKKSIISYSHELIPIAPLVIFRIVFGALMCFSTIRFAYNGWITSSYITPSFFFPFFDWQWIQPLPNNGMYVVFFLIGLAAFFICIGFLFRISSILFFLLFTYTELIDKTFYLNHYYLVCLLSFLLTLTLANRTFSIDTLLFPHIKRSVCPRWQVGIFKVQLSIVYFFAGLGKVNPDWLFHAEPMATWLPSKYQIPLLGKIVGYKITAYLFSWMGCLYDLTIWIFLLWKPTRKLAYVGVIVFHILTSILFPQIGIFPYIMIVCTVIFFSTQWHQNVLSKIQTSNLKPQTPNSKPLNLKSQIMTFSLGVYILIQLYLPLRHLQYPGHLFWHEQGFRFSWRVMLIEKAGMTAIILKDPKTGLQQEIDQCDYLTKFQQKQMATQPDMILQFAHFIGDQFKEENGYPPQLFVKSRLSLNGNRSKEFTNDTVDLYPLTNSYKKRNWVLPFKDAK